MEIHDALGLLKPDLVRTVAQAIGASPPLVVRQLGRPVRRVRYGLKFGDHTGVPPQVLTVDLIGGAWGFPLAHELAALRQLQFVQEIPSQSTLTVLPAQLFGVPSAIGPFHDHVDGARRVALDPSSWEQVAGDLGRTLVRLWSVPQPRHGLRADGGRFVPTARTWREEWHTHVRALADGARVTGVDLGWLSRELVGRIEERLGALDGVRPVLVHGSPSLDALAYTAQAEPELAQVTGWDHAMAGDLLVDVAHLLTNPPQALGPVFAGVGAERVREWLEPTAIRRLEIYVYTGILRRVRAVADHILSLRDTSTLGTLADIAAQAPRVLEPDFVERQLRAALDHLDGSQSAESSPTPPHRALAHRALDLLRVDPPLEAEVAPLALAALGAAALAHACPAHTAACQAAVEQLQDSLPRFGLAVLGLPIDDRDAWLGALVDDVVAATAATPLPCHALAVLWVAARALHAVDWTVSDALLRHLEGTVRGLIVSDEVQANADLDPALGLTLSMIGAAALVDLPELSPSTTADCAGLLAELEEQATEQLERLDPGAMPIPQLLQGDDLADQAMRGLVGTQGLTRPVVALALHVARGRARLPADAATLIARCGQ